MSEIKIVSILASLMMGIGELFGLGELKDLTGGYTLTYNWRNVIFILNRGTSFDVFAYVDAKAGLFEHIFTSEDHGYSIDRVVSTIQRYGEEIAHAHLDSSDIYFRGWTFEEARWGYVRQDIASVLQILPEMRYVAPRPVYPVHYAISNTSIYESHTVMIRDIDKWVEVREGHSVKASYLEGRVIDLQEPTQYPLPHRRIDARIAWMRTICDDEGNVLDRVQLNGDRCLCDCGCELEYHDGDGFFSCGSCGWSNLVLA